MSKHGKPSARDEMTAIITAYEALAALEPGARMRAIEWIVDRLAFRHADLGRESTSTSEVPARGRKRGKGTTRAASGTGPLAELMRRKEPQTEMERVLCVAVFVVGKKGGELFTTRELTTANAEARLPAFTNASLALSHAVGRKLVDTQERGVFSLTGAGRALVDSLPARDAVEALKRGAPEAVPDGVTPESPPGTVAPAHVVAEETAAGASGNGDTASPQVASNSDASDEAHQSGNP